MEQELDGESDFGRGPAVDPPIRWQTSSPPLFRDVITLPVPLAVTRRYFGVQVQRVQDVVAGVRLRQKYCQVQIETLLRNIFNDIKLVYSTI